MAQLIKLQDYISRYEWNAYRYPGQYIRLKQENWQKLYQEWKEPRFLEEPMESEDVSSRFSKLKAFIKKDIEPRPEVNEEEMLPDTEKGLRHYFLDRLFPFQLKWATSTVTDVSFMDKKYEKDQTLKYFLQRFPDNYLLMYHPIFNIKNVPVDGEIIMISPIRIEIIYLIEETSDATIMASDERTWVIEKDSIQSKILSPLIALKRTEQIVRSILNKDGIDFPVQKTVLSQKSPIVFFSEPYNTRIIGKHEYPGWFKEKRALESPLKNRQLKAAEQLLRHCLTTSVKRPEWEEEHSFTVVGED